MIPQTPLQKVVYGLMMAVMMVYGMEVYNAALIFGRLSPGLLIVPVKEMVLLTLIVIVLQASVAGPTARSLTLRIIDPRRSKPIVMILTLSVWMVLIMCPLMSLIALLVFKGFSHTLFSEWIHTYLCNLPMAFSWQLLVAGPLVRGAFKMMFARDDGRMRAS